MCLLSGYMEAEADYQGRQEVFEDAGTLEDVYEPYLMQIGFLNRTPRGRCATQKAYNHLGIPFAGQLEF